MTGPDFRKRVTFKNGKLNQEAFDEIWPSLRVLARSSPTDKYLLVSGETTLETSGEHVKNYTRNERRRCETTLKTSGEGVKLDSKRVEKF